MKIKNIRLDLLIILSWTVMTFVFFIIPTLDDSIIRTILGVPMVLFIPGYVLVMALFTKKNELGSAEIICISFGLSIVVISLLGLFLDLTFGIRLTPMIIILCTYIIIMVSVSMYRQRMYEDIVDNVIPKIVLPKRRIDTILTMILIFMSILTVITIYYAIMTPKIGERFTEFYVLNSDRKADNYSTSMMLNSPVVLLTGVVNNEYQHMNYTVNVVIDKDVLATEKLSLNHGDMWEKNITFVPDKVGDNVKLEILLFKEDDYTIPYRKLHLWATVT